jgi:hypothetical protein
VEAPGFTDCRESTGTDQEKKILKKNLNKTKSPRLWPDYGLCPPHCREYAAPASRAGVMSGPPACIFFFIKFFFLFYNIFIFIFYSFVL